MNNKRKMFATVIGIVLAVVTATIGIYAADITTELTLENIKAIEAGVVCEEHLAQYCTECEGYSPDASYAVYCPYCDVKMTLCCSGQCAINDNFANCLYVSHPDGCKNVQDLYWNAYICMDCGYFERGSKSDDTHLEAYWHTMDSTAYDHAYCSKPKLSDLLELVSEEGGVEVMAKSNDLEDRPYYDAPNDPVLAGDYCEVHEIFSCDIPHNDVIS